MTDFLELEHPIGVSQYLRSASAGRRLNLQTMNQRPQAASELDDTESSIPQTGSSRSLLRNCGIFFRCKLLSCPGDRGFAVEEQKVQDRLRLRLQIYKVQSL